MSIHSRTGQIWIETVIYTLIGLSLIGLTMAILTPQIKEFRDRSTIEETIAALNVFDSKINEILDAPGNKRKINLMLDRGVFAIDPATDSLSFILQEAHVKYSEPGISLPIGRVNVTTQAEQETYTITLGLQYAHNLTFEGSDTQSVSFTPVTIPYEFFVENRGREGPHYSIEISEGN